MFDWSIHSIHLYSHHITLEFWCGDKIHLCPIHFEPMSLELADQLGAMTVYHRGYEGGCITCWDSDEEEDTK